MNQHILLDLSHLLGTSWEQLTEQIEGSRKGWYFFTLLPDATDLFFFKMVKYSQICENMFWYLAFSENKEQDKANMGFVAWDISSKIPSFCSYYMIEG